MPEPSKVLKCLVCKGVAHGQQINSQHCIWCSRCANDPLLTTWLPLFYVTDPSNRIANWYIPSETGLEKLFHDFLAKATEGLKPTEASGHASGNLLNEVWGFRLVE